MTDAEAEGDVRSVRTTDMIDGPTPERRLRRVVQ
jgi:hypothetical protein